MCEGSRDQFRGTTTVDGVSRLEREDSEKVLGLSHVSHYPQDLKNTHKRVWFSQVDVRYTRASSLGCQKT